MRVTVVEYEPDWPELFDSLSARLRGVVEELDASIEHVGSTAVPGLAAKPVIDIDIVVAGRDVRRAIELLAAIGYEHRGNLGIPQREAFRAPSELPRHHLYVCPVGSIALANHLSVRDHLRENPHDAKAYGHLKKRLARGHPQDIDSYIEGKSEFLAGILRLCGLPESTVSGIQEMNRK